VVEVVGAGVLDADVVGAVLGLVDVVVGGVTVPVVAVAVEPPGGA
jgi:hypothetical protein